MVMNLELASHIARQLGLDEHGLHIDRVPGGDIAESWLLEAADHWVFVKTLPLGQAAILSSEEDGLKALAEQGSVRVPRVIAREVHDQIAWLALEYLDMESRSPRCDAALGQALAGLHRQTSEHFGWRRDNFIGRSPQPNPPTQDWAEFFLWHRLGFQLDLLHKHQPDHDWERFQRPLFETWQRRFGKHRPQPSLIHGDLWQGNAGMIEGQVPVIFDPAVHYADRECDLAMARLFGGFDDRFYQAYEETWPLPEGHVERRPFYQLYHLLNHANLFGGAYLQRTRAVIAQLLG
jgi:protein-ribulosamine 3-kinase